MALGSSIVIGSESSQASRAPVIKVVRLITGLGIGGPELGVLESIRHFDRTRFQFVVGCLYNNGTVGRQLEELGVPVFDMGMRSRYDPAALLRLWQFLRAERPDVLHTHLCRANIWGRVIGGALRVPVIISSEHGLTHDAIEGYPRTRLTAALDKWTALSCDRIIAVSEATRRCLLENRIPAEKIEVVLNSINTSLFAAADGAAVRAEFGLGDAAVITIVARLHPDKNHALLIEAFSRLRARYGGARYAEAKLLIVGGGPLEQALRAQAEASAPGAVVFAGMRGDIPAIMAASDIVVLCSNRETFGRAAVEAMSAAKPVIGTAVGGIPEVIVDGQTGLLVPLGDVSALGGAMEKLLNDRETAARMGLAGRARAQQLFDIRRSVGRFQEIYSELYGKFASAAGKCGPARAERKSSAVSADAVAGTAASWKQRVKREEN